MTVAAADERFDPKAVKNGGFAPVQNDAYREQCGRCHMAYLPGLLPARSWTLLMRTPGDHFGERLAITPEQARDIESYLTANAADRVQRVGSELVLARVRASDTPKRITQLPLVRSRHAMLGTDSRAPPRPIANCVSCHRGAEAGDFSGLNVQVPSEDLVPRRP